MKLGFKSGDHIFGINWIRQVRWIASNRWCKCRLIDGYFYFSKKKTCNLSCRHCNVIVWFLAINIIFEYRLRKAHHLFLQDIDTETQDQLYFLSMYLRICRDLLHKQGVRKGFQWILEGSCKTKTHYPRAEYIRLHFGMVGLYIQRTGTRLRPSRILHLGTDEHLLRITIT